MSRLLPKSMLAALALSAVIGLASGPALAGHGGHGAGHHASGHVGHVGHVGHIGHVSHVGTSDILPTAVISATFALPLIRAGHIAIGPGATGTAIFGPGVVGITGCVGSTGLGDG